MSAQRVLVYRNQPLPISEVFVYNQSVRLRRYQAFFLGAKYPRGPRLPLPETRVYLLNKGAPVGLLREFLFKFLQYVPKDVLEWSSRIGPAAIHAHFGPDGAMALPIAVKLRLPLVVSFLGTDVTLHDQYGRRLHWSHRLYLLRRKRLSDLLTAAIVPSEFLREAIIAQGFPEHRIHIIAHGVDLTRFVPGERTAIEAGKVLYVGRLVERKGLHLLIDALEQARQALPTITLTVIGDGPMRSEFEARALAKLGEGFEFLGAQPQDIVHEHLRSAQVFAMPSITMPNGEVETFGLVYAEAQAMRVPVVAFASGGISEVVAHGETGFLAPEGDIRELAGYIQQLMVEPDLCGKMGDAGRRRVERLFDLDKQNAKLEALYDELRPPA